MNQTPAIELQDVSVIYNQGTPDAVVALRGISLVVQKGETIVITGGNGSGKSTLLRAIAGTAPVTSGKIFIAGNDVTNWRPHRRAKLLGFIYQDPMMGTCPNMTVHDNFRLVAGKHWYSISPERLQMEEGQLALVKASGLPLDTKSGSILNTLSGGQRQGAALVLALSSNRSILLMDEFTSSLDNAVRASYLALIAHQSQQQALTILAVLHDLDGANVLSFREIHLESGMIRNTTKTP